MGISSASGRAHFDWHGFDWQGFDWQGFDWQGYSAMSPGQRAGKKGFQSFTPAQLESAGARFVAGMLPAVQRWAHMQADAIVSRGTFTAEDRNRLALNFSTQFQAANADGAEIGVRFLALRKSAPGGLARLFGAKGGPSALQKQLMGGVKMTG